MKKYIIGSIILYIAIGTTFIFYRGSTTKSATPRCPDDYANDDAGSAEHLASMDKWTNDFYDAHPGATLSDWSAARYQFWVDNNCSKAIERYRKAKNIESGSVVQ
jgi:hypothetical protein